MPLTAAHLTAIARRSPSRPIRDNVVHLEKGWRILDYGCGRGFDVAWLKEQGFTDAQGFDSYSTFGFFTEPHGKYDAVIATYVLNVIEEPSDRDFFLAQLKDCLKPGGRLIISTRSISDVETAARKGSWIRLNDGYMTPRGTFQKGYTPDELAQLIRKTFKAAPQVKRVADYVCGVL